MFSFALLPNFKLAKEYDGKSSAARWLAKLQYDFAQNNQVPPPPALYLRAIKVLFIGDAATWLDSTPRIRQIIDNRNSATAVEVQEFEEALKDKFPAGAEIHRKRKRCCSSHRQPANNVTGDNEQAELAEPSGTKSECCRSTSYMLRRELAS